jgi:outer membrane protein OmpA-like peptidoglycan-associated protein/tetratricopeptide (TPR) repeat protein
MKRLFIYMFCFLLSLPAIGQRTQQRIAVGDDFYQKEQYQQAIKVYQRILRNEKQPQTKQELSFKIGESYRRLVNYAESKKWYTIATNLGYSNPEVYLHLSEMTLGLEEFDLSINHIEKFLAAHPDDPRGLKLKQSAYFARDNYNTETIFEVSNEGSINNEGQQWGAAFLENVAVVYQDQAKVDEQFDIDIRLRYNNVFYWVWMSRTLKERIVFSSTQSFTGSNGGYSNIYQATFNRRLGDWDAPKLLPGEINSNYYDGFLSYDEENEIAYFMNSGGQTGNRATADIYIVQYNPQDDTWGTPQMFPFNSDEYNIGYPSISNDGQTLYFASDMAGGMGGYDIYKITKDENDQWGEPVNLGETINTPFNDSYPYIAGNVLYFSSYGHPGFGGFDVFYSLIDEEGNYSEPQNLGVPINSSADDFGFIIDRDYTRGFFSSNRPGGKGEDDLFSFRVVPKTFTVQGRVTDDDTGLPVAGMEIFFYDDNNNFYASSTNSDGFYNLPDLSTDVNYYINAYPDGYFELTDTLAVRDQLLANRFAVIRDFEKNFALIPASRIIEEPEPVLAEQTQTIAPPVEEPSIEEVINDIVEEISTPEPVVETIPERIIEEPVAIVEETPVIQQPDPVKTTQEFTLSAVGFPVIYFEFGKAELTPVAIRQLDTVIRFMQSNPEKGVIIHAHTDVISGYLFNFFLSQQRAQSILAHLRRNNVDPARVYPLGHGKTRLAVTTARSEQEHRLNRRATFESIPMEQLQAYLEDASRHSFRYLNSIEKEAHFAHGIEFMVQFMASNVPINPQFYRKIMDNLPDVDIIYYYDTDRYHRYLVGSFSDFDSAFEMQRTLRQLGYEIYVVAFNNGERIPVSRARRLAAEI